MEKENRKKELLLPIIPELPEEVQEEGEEERCYDSSFDLNIIPCENYWGWHFNR